MSSLSDRIPHRRRFDASRPTKVGNRSEPIDSRGRWMRNPRLPTAADPRLRSEARVFARRAQLPGARPAALGARPLRRSPRQKTWPRPDGSGAQEGCALKSLRGPKRRNARWADRLGRRANRSSPSDEAVPRTGENMSLRPARGLERGCRPYRCYGNRGRDGLARAASRQNRELARRAGEVEKHYSRSFA